MGAASHVGTDKEIESEAREVTEPRGWAREPKFLIPCWRPLYTVGSENAPVGEKVWFYRALDEEEALQVLRYEENYWQERGKSLGFPRPRLYSLVIETGK